LVELLVVLVRRGAGDDGVNSTVPMGRWSICLRRALGKV